MPNIGALNFIKQTLLDLKSQTDHNTMIVREFSTPLSPILVSSRPKKKFNKEMSKCSDTIDQMDLPDNYRIFHPSTAKHTFFSESHRTFYKIDI
jgi:hypothetical protein